MHNLRAAFKEENNNPGSKDYSDRQRTAVCIDAVPPLAQRRAAHRLFVGPLAATLLVGQQRLDVRLNVGSLTKDRR